jgi:23S rRNA pseudouridine2605 synthase
MFQTAGHLVSKLKRTAIGPLRDGRLPPGAWRALTTGEVKALVRSLAPAAGSEPTERGSR